MKNYNIYMNPQGDYRAIKEGWSWTAFFFIWIWALINKLWKLGLIVMIVWVTWTSVVSGVIIDRANDTYNYLSTVYGGSLAGAASSEATRIMTTNMIFFILLPMLVMCVVFGKSGNKWLTRRLLARGYDSITTVEALTPEGAIATYLKEHKT